jgi:Holliday junction resolvasome RuvABC DNA-binding subunit
MLRDAILALSALGFSEETANKMVSKVVESDPKLKDVESVIRAALSGK